jgi:D-glycero-alpha-D-manno-heptose-7-phosphate kinase
MDKKKMIKVWARAPVRVDPAGAGTDCPPFSVEQGGLVVNFAIRKYVFATFERLPKGSGVLIYSHDLKKGIYANSIHDLKLSDSLDFLKSFLVSMVPGGESCLLETQADVPESSGLGGSAALGVAVTAAIDRAYERKRSPMEIAEAANSIERDYLGLPGGSQDSYGTSFGGVNAIEYIKGGGVRSKKIDINDTTRLQLETQSLLVYTGSSHISGSIHDDIRKSYAVENSPTRKAMFGLREQASLMISGLEKGELQTYARALNKSRWYHYALHESCDSQILRQYFAQLDPLILGGKTCGAGGGGFILIYAKPTARRDCIEIGKRLGGMVWPVSIDFDGVRTWHDLPSTERDIHALKSKIEDSISKSVLIAK